MTNGEMTNDKMRGLDFLTPNSEPRTPNSEPKRVRRVMSLLSFVISPFFISPHPPSIPPSLSERRADDTAKAEALEERCVVFVVSGETLRPALGVEIFSDSFENLIHRSCAAADQPEVFLSESSHDLEKLDHLVEKSDRVVA